MKRYFRTTLEYGDNNARLDFINLRFVKSERHLEEKFQDKFFCSNIAHLRICHFYTIFFYTLASFIDYWLLPEDLMKLLAIRLLIVVPVLLFGYFFTFSARYKKVWREISFFYILLTGSSFIAFTVIGHAPEAYDYWVGIMFCLVFGYTFIREPFIYGSVAGAILLIGYLTVATMVTNIC